MNPTQKIKARIVQGHGAASGRKNDPRYPEGTIRAQLPYFRERGLDLSKYYPGTVNLDIEPYRCHMKKPRHEFKQVDWSPYISPENFFFFDVGLITGNLRVSGLIYMPDPSTKEEHFQKNSILELLLPWTEKLAHGEELWIEVDREQIYFEKEGEA